MKQNRLAAMLALLLSLVGSAALGATSQGQAQDTDARMVGARVVEVAECHISVMARSGVEHVIAVDAAGTKVTVSGETASLKDIRDGDLVTVELDVNKAVKFAKRIEVRSDQVAKVRR
ncbi:MAG: hypothetical protein QOJ64_53 [Acidobacteriota bacterium]|jgi:hypothetical protein|nr:hypothetical protein [Acidobacteriota bacterium]